MPSTRNRENRSRGRTFRKCADRFAEGELRKLLICYAAKVDGPRCSFWSRELKNCQNCQFL
jgi:hypothetical protein